MNALQTPTYIQKLPNVLWNKIFEFGRPNNWAIHENTCKLFRERISKTWESEAKKLGFKVSAENAKEKVVDHFFLPKINDCLLKYIPIEEIRSIKDPAAKNQRIMNHIKEANTLETIITLLTEACETSPENAGPEIKTLLFLIRVTDPQWIMENFQLFRVKNHFIQKKIIAEVIQLIPQGIKNAYILFSYLIQNSEYVDFDLAKLLISKYDSLQGMNCGIRLSYEAFKDSPEKYAELIIALIKKGDRPDPQDSLFIPDEIWNFIQAEIKAAEKTG